MESRSVRWLAPAEGDLADLAGLGIVVVGYGNQGRAQALNLRDSGAGRWVRVWARPGGNSAARAREDGFDVLSSAELATGEIFLCLLPDEAQREFVSGVLTPSLRRAGRRGCIGFAHGFALAFTDLGAELRREPWREVFLVAPSGPGDEVRGAYVDGRGIAALLAVWHDESGRARRLAAAIAHGIGAFRAGVLETTVRDEAVVDLFGEQSVLCGGLAALITAAFRTLTAAGYAPEMAYLECIQQVHLTAELVRRYGVAGMRSRISRIAHYGDLTRGPRVLGAEVSRSLAEILNEIESGQFAAEWLAEYDRGLPMLQQARAAQNDLLLEQVGRDLRQRLGSADDFTSRGVE